MNIEEYFTNLTDEISALKNRVRHYIDDAHWLSDGEWKESVVRTILRRHLPDNIGVGRGFILNFEHVSTQIDVLLYDKFKPILFQDGDFIITTPDATLGAIEVKTRIRQKNDLRDALKKLSNVSNLVLPIVPFQEKRFFGLFAYEEPDNSYSGEVLNILQDCVNGQRQKIINCICIGKDVFVRFWPGLPDNILGSNKWHSYHLKNKAPAYFIHNVIDHLCPQWANKNNDVWYPESGKENYKISEISLCKPEQIS